jgi:hypothetical protein
MSMSHHRRRCPDCCQVYPCDCLACEAPGYCHDASCGRSEDEGTLCELRAQQQAEER